MSNLEVLDDLIQKMHRRIAAAMDGGLTSSQIKDLMNQLYELMDKRREEIRFTADPSKPIIHEHHYYHHDYHSPYAPYTPPYPWWGQVWCSNGVTSGTVTLDSRDTGNTFLTSAGDTSAFTINTGAGSTTLT